MQDEIAEVEGLGELIEKVEGLVEVLEQQVEQAEPTPEEIEAEQQLQEEQQLLMQQQVEDESQFRELLLTELKVLNENTVALIEKTEDSNSMFEEVAPVAKQASEWILIAIVVMFLLWVVKQFEDMFNAAFR